MIEDNDGVRFLVISMVKSKFNNLWVEKVLYSKFVTDMTTYPELFVRHPYDFDDFEEIKQ